MADSEEKPKKKDGLVHTGHDFNENNVVNSGFFKAVYLGKGKNFIGPIRVKDALRDTKCHKNAEGAEEKKVEETPKEEKEEKKTEPAKKSASLPKKSTPVKKVKKSAKTQKVTKSDDRFFESNIDAMIANKMFGGGKVRQFISTNEDELNSTYDMFDAIRGMTMLGGFDIKTEFAGTARKAERKNRGKYTAIGQTNATLSRVNRGLSKKSRMELDNFAKMGNIANKMWAKSAEQYINMFEGKTKYVIPFPRAVKFRDQMKEQYYKVVKTNPMLDTDAKKAMALGEIMRDTALRRKAVEDAYISRQKELGRHLVKADVHNNMYNEILDKLKNMSKTAMQMTENAMQMTAKDVQTADKNTKAKWSALYQSKFDEVSKSIDEDIKTFKKTYSMDEVDDFFFFTRGTYGPIALIQEYNIACLISDFENGGPSKEPVDFYGISGDVLDTVENLKYSRYREANDDEKMFRDFVPIANEENDSKDYLFLVDNLKKVIGANIQFGLALEKMPSNMITTLDENGNPVNRPFAELKSRSGLYKSFGVNLADDIFTVGSNKYLCDLIDKRASPKERDTLKRDWLLMSNGKPMLLGTFFARAREDPENLINSLDLYDPLFTYDNNNRNGNLIYYVIDKLRQFHSIGDSKETAVESPGNKRLRLALEDRYDTTGHSNAKQAFLIKEAKAGANVKDAIRSNVIFAKRSGELAGQYKWFKYDPVTMEGYVRKTEDGEEYFDYAKYIGDGKKIGNLVGPFSEENVAGANDVVNPSPTFMLENTVKNFVKYLNAAKDKQTGEIIFPSDDKIKADVERYLADDGKEVGLLHKYAAMLFEEYVSKNKDKVDDKTLWYKSVEMLDMARAAIVKDKRAVRDKIDERIRSRDEAHFDRVINTWNDQGKSMFGGHKGDEATYEMKIGEDAEKIRSELQDFAEMKGGKIDGMYGNNMQTAVDIQTGTHTTTPKMIKEEKLFKTLQYKIIAQFLPDIVSKYKTKGGGEFRTDYDTFTGYLKGAGLDGERGLIMYLYYKNILPPDVLKNIKEDDVADFDKGALRQAKKVTYAEESGGNYKGVNYLRVKDSLAKALGVATGWIGKYWPKIVGTKLFSEMKGEESQRIDENSQKTISEYRGSPERAYDVSQTAQRKINNEEKSLQEKIDRLKGIKLKDRKPKNTEPVLGTDDIINYLNKEELFKFINKNLSRDGLSISDSEYGLVKDTLDSILNPPIDYKTKEDPEPTAQEEETPEATPMTKSIRKSAAYERLIRRISILEGNGIFKSGNNLGFIRAIKKAADFEMAAIKKTDGEGEEFNVSRYRRPNTPHTPTGKEAIEPLKISGVDWFSLFNELGEAQRTESIINNNVENGGRIALRHKNDRRKGDVVVDRLIPYQNKDATPIYGEPETMKPLIGYDPNEPIYFHGVSPGGDYNYVRRRTGVSSKWPSRKNINKKLKEIFDEVPLPEGMDAYDFLKKLYKQSWDKTGSISGMIDDITKRVSGLKRGESASKLLDPVLTKEELAQKRIDDQKKRYENSSINPTKIDKEIKEILQQMDDERKKDTMLKILESVGLQHGIPVDRYIEEFKQNEAWYRMIHNEPTSIEINKEKPKTTKPAKTPEEEEIDRIVEMTNAARDKAESEQITEPEETEEESPLGALQKIVAKKFGTKYVNMNGIVQPIDNSMVKKAINSYNTYGDIPYLFDHQGIPVNLMVDKNGKPIINPASNVGEKYPGFDEAQSKFNVLVWLLASKRASGQITNDQWENMFRRNFVERGKEIGSMSLDGRGVLDASNKDKYTGEKVKTWEPEHVVSNAPTVDNVDASNLKEAMEHEIDLMTDILDELKSNPNSYPGVDPEEIQNALKTFPKLIKKYKKYLKSPLRQLPYDEFYKLMEELGVEPRKR